MAIKCSFKRVPIDETGKAYDSLEAFQAAEMQKLVTQLTDTNAADIVSLKDEVIEILELTLDARPAARGVKKPRKAKSAPATNCELPPATA